MIFYIPSRLAGLLAAASVLLTVPAQAQVGSPLRRVLRTDTSAVMRKVLAHPDAYRLQVLYTQIDRDAQNQPHFRTYKYRVHPRRYFYPASTVKLPAAVLALEKLRALRSQIPELTPESPLRIDSAYEGQTRVVRDTSAATGRASIAQYVRKVLLVSDNDAFNRLYEFVGRSQLRYGLRRRGYHNTRLLHRLSVGDKGFNALHTNPFAFYADTALERPIYVQPAAAAKAEVMQELPRRGEKIGKAYMDGDKLINEPMDFSQKNFVSLADQQNILKSVLFPGAVPAKNRFALAPDDYQFLRGYLSMLPRESDHPRYDAAHYPDNYAKFLLAGGSPAPLPPNVRIFNKIGQAYGFLIDNAYIVDYEHNIEFMLSAVIYVNSDEVLNDDHYDYDAVGFPFLHDLGHAVYRRELVRTRKHRPDLREFQLKYSQ
ncbi:class A beta-lactamase-related serine hydrolase [Hymenobacter sp. BT491]|uniref:class A beta-lactamase-related serine hydrolase n=1 Tax=Hymenobacter sp. BT491 TaxID=2766779 RepID=UPI0021CCC653|nr:class A beta-lactamase-related serine hydrolase [Hymenobacter sp. BT491]